MNRYFIVGGAGFIGSHFTDRLLSDEVTGAVTLYDNFSSGQRWHYSRHESDGRLRVITGDVRSLQLLEQSMRGHDVVIHLASNPDISRAATEPTIDFEQGTFLTQNVIEAMRRAGVPRILYASGSGVYGDLGEIEAQENHGPLAPVSTYGASKLAGEALICSYVHMFGLTACVFRFGNVVGPRQTHGVGLDFLRRLQADPTRLRILGDGQQSKSYVHVTDVVNAVLLASDRSNVPYNTFNVATGDYVTVREIAQVVVECLGLENVTFDYSGGDRGWKGDVPIVRLDASRIRSLGWQCQMGSREAVRQAVIAMRDQAPVATEQSLAAALTV